MSQITTIIFTPREPVAPGSSLLFGIPFDTPEQSVAGVSVEHAFNVVEVSARNSGQKALRFDAGAAASPVVRLSFRQEPSGFPEWTFASTGGAHETPSEDLRHLVTELAPTDLPAAARVERIVRHVEERFTYGVRDVGLGDFADAMPALSCDTHLGTCVDTHSYAVAAMRAAGFPAAYISGIFFPEGASCSEPGHCWFAVRAEGAPHHWDISHFLKYNLGPVRPVLNPKPGRRFALSVGRDLVFEGPDGDVPVTRLSGFNAIANGAARKIATQADIAL